MQKAFDYIEKYHMIDANDKVIVGVSGGADSLCLLFVLRDYRQKVPFELAVVHVEHGIRGEQSLADARFVEELCRREKIECYLVSEDVPELAKRGKMSLEEAGRAARYEAFERVRKETGADRIAVAHNRNDQAETMLFRMARGSGLVGAGGIRPVRGRIIRPLLSCSREEIEEYLRERGISWRTDQTNEDTDFARNCLRSRVLPLLTQSVNAAADAHLAALGEELQRLWEYMEEQAKNRADTMAVCERGRAKIQIGAFLRETEIMQEYILRECFARAGCARKDFTRRHFQSVRELTAMQSGRTVTLPGGWLAKRQFSCLILEKGGAPLKDAEPFCRRILGPGEYEGPGGTFEIRVFPYKNENILQKTYTKWLDYDKISNNLLIRTRRPGDFIVIDQKGGRKKIKDYLIGEKVPAGERDRVPLLADGSEILWVAGHRISEAYKVVPQTKNVFEIRWRRKGDGGESDSDDTGRCGQPQDRGDGEKDQ